MVNWAHWIIVTSCVNFDTIHKMLYQNGGWPSYLVLEIKSEKLLLAFAMFQL